MVHYVAYRASSHRTLEYRQTSSSALTHVGPITIQGNSKADIIPQIQGRAFQHQFHPPSPAPVLIEEIWRRLLPDRSASLSETLPHPKGFVIAILYMLHIESNYGYRKPKGRDSRNARIVVLSEQRRELCKSFGYWAPCQCGNECGKRWNFANNEGLSSGVNAVRGCGVANAITTFGGKGVALEEYGGSKAWLNTRRLWEKGMT